MMLFMFFIALALAKIAICLPEPMNDWSKEAEASSSSLNTSLIGHETTNSTEDHEQRHTSIDALSENGLSLHEKRALEEFKRYWKSTQKLIQKVTTLRLESLQQAETILRQGNAPRYNQRSRHRDAYYQAVSNLCAYNDKIVDLYRKSYDAHNPLYFLSMSRNLDAAIKMATDHTETIGKMLNWTVPEHSFQPHSTDDDQWRMDALKYAGYDVSKGIHPIDINAWQQNQAQEILDQYS